NKHVGFVALGGNRNTCYFQIEGVGCRTVLEHTSLFRLHWWLDLLGCSRLSRIDLAVDDFHGLFGREYAKKAYSDDAFRTARAGRAPNGGERLVSEPNGKIINESFEVGSRESRIYWRIYNKAAQLGLDMHWFRNEVELKDMPIDVLLNIEGYFAGLCAYSASIINSLPVKV
ncbi:TPA: replication initiation factor domain-containing protein, partial [Vibrio cholerae]